MADIHNYIKNIRENVIHIKLDVRYIRKYMKRKSDSHLKVIESRFEMNV